MLCVFTSFNPGKDPMSKHFISFTLHDNATKWDCYAQVTKHNLTLSFTEAASQDNMRSYTLSCSAHSRPSIRDAIGILSASVTALHCPCCTKHGGLLGHRVTVV